MLLVEKDEPGRDKACGDLVSLRSLEHVEALGAMAPLVAGEPYRLRQASLVSPRGHRATFALSRRTLALGAAGLLIPRAELDRALLEAAGETVERAGGEVRTRTRVLDMIWRGRAGGEDPGPGSGDERRAAGVRLRAPHGGVSDVLAPVVIGAGGCNCPVARAVLGETYGEPVREPRHLAVSYREYWTGLDEGFSTQGGVEILFLPEVAPGYFWIFPVGRGVANVGVGMRLDAMRNVGDKPRSLMRRAMCESGILRRRFAGAAVVAGSGLGSILPLGSPRLGRTLQPRRSFADGVLLVGDSASIVDPLSGEGIANALVSGELAAELAKVAVAQGACNLAMGRRYQRQLWSRLGRSLITAHRLQHLMPHRWVVDWIVRQLQKRPRIPERLAGLPVGEHPLESRQWLWLVLRELLAPTRAPASIGTRRKG